MAKDKDKKEEPKKSEMQRELEQIDLQNEAAQQALHGLAQVGGHEAIQARSGALESYYKQLLDLGLSPEEAMQEAIDLADSVTPPSTDTPDEGKEGKKKKK